MTTTDWVQAIAMVVLVVVTIFYAYQAKKARDSAEASAQASVKMAEETREQRYSESLPLLVPHITFAIQVAPNELDYELLQAGQGRSWWQRGT
jgi:predicted histidine transporter YuiF (NhaC family)